MGWTIECRDRRGRLACSWASLALCMTLLAAGCGGDSEPENVVQPPQPSAGDSGSGLKNSPGGLELPPGEIPAEAVETSPSPEGGLEMPKDIDVPENAGAANNGAEIQYGTWEEIEKLARSTGRITVVDLWSLSCDPCLKEFPGLVRLHKDHGDKVQCIAVDLDFDGRKSRPPEHYEERVVAFLKSVGAAGFPTYISSTPSDDVFSTADLISIPAVLIFDAKGEIAMKFVDAGDTVGFTYEKDIIPFVQKIQG